MSIVINFVMRPYLLYYKVFTPRHKFVIEKHEGKRLDFWKNRASSDDKIIIARCVLVRSGYTYLYHYERIRFS